MNVFVAATAAVLVIFSEPRVEGTLDELIARNEAECTSAQPGADCGAIRAELELRLYDDLRMLDRMGEDVDREAIRTAAAANFPQLALLALRWMEEDPVAGDDEAIALALENRSAAVRSVALRLLVDRLPARVKALREWILAQPNSQDEDLVPDADPDADLLGFSPYPGARLVRFASGKQRAFYTTPDPQQKVIATIGKGKTVLDYGSFLERVSAAIELPDYEAIGAELEKLLSETDPDKMAAAQEKAAALMAPQSQGSELAAAFSPLMNRSNAQFVILREQPAPTPDTLPRIKRAAAVFREDSLGITVIFVPLQ
jgi:hypothetical protein